MPRGKAATDVTMLQMALVGYEIEKQKIEEKIREIRAQIGGRAVAAAPQAAPRRAEAPRKRTLSASARRRIAAAQKRRWAEHRKKMAQAAKSE